MTVNQRDNNLDSQWNLLGTYDFENFASIVIDVKIKNSTSADAIRFVKVSDIVGNQCIDNDEDNYGNGCFYGNDCDDNNQVIHPGADEICGNGIDEDCSGGDLACENNSANLTDTNNTINNETETNVTNDDSTLLHTYYFDNDGDGYGGDIKIESESPILDYVEEGNDCDDDNLEINPGAMEICDGEDNDCDDLIDEDDVCMISLETEEIELVDNALTSKRVEYGRDYKLYNGDSSHIVRFEKEDEKIVMDIDGERYDIEGIEEIDIGEESFFLKVDTQDDENARILFALETSLLEENADYKSIYYSIITIIIIIIFCVIGFLLYRLINKD